MRVNSGPRAEGVESRAHKPVIALMAKAPIPGAAKTRLAALLGEHGAAEIYRHFLEDTLAVARQVPDASTCIVCPNEMHRQVLIELMPDDVDVMAQRDPGLMAGLAWSFTTLFQAGASKVLLIDADSPTLPTSVLVQAFEILESVDVCLGPCPDGGYYLIGARRDCPGLFDGVAASTAGTFEQTMARARDLGLSTGLLPFWFDVDTEDDFRLFLAHLNERDGAPSTRAWLARAGWIEQPSSRSDRVYVSE